MHRGDDWALRVPAGSRVRVSPTAIGVDAPDGRRWFDISWHDADLPPASIAWAWGGKACGPITWDEPKVPVEGTWTSGGLCSIGERRHWAFTVVERHGERLLFTAWIGEHRRLPYEDAWVDFARTALSLRAGAEPLPPVDHADLRGRVREAAALRPGHMPVPGGGLLSGRVSERLVDVWAARLASPPPASFQAATDTTD